MGTFTVRVELHGASGDDYTRLHSEMAKSGYRIYVSGGDGHSYALPTAEYDLTSVQNDQFVIMKEALAIATRVRPRPEPWVLVTKAEGQRAISSARLK